MPWRSSRGRGLLLPRDRRVLNPGAPLAQGLASLWVPALGLTPAGLTNLVTADPATLDFGPGSAVPAFASTDFGPGLAFDGTDDYALKMSSVYQPSYSFPLTMAAVVRLDVVPGVTTVIYTFCSANLAFTVELNVRPGRTRIVFTGDGNATSTLADLSVNPTQGQVALIVGVLDSYSTARLSLYEPATGLFQSAVNTSGTTTSSAASNFLDYEALGASHPGAPSDYTAVTVLDAWAWNRALSDDDIALWRRDRWSVLRAAPPRTLPTLAATGSTASATQTLLRPTQTATLARKASAQQALTLPPVTQTTGSTSATFAQQLTVLPPLTQTADAKMVAKASQGTYSVTGSGVTFDSTTVNFDSTTVTFDSGATSSGVGLPLSPPTQTAHIQALPPGLFSSQTLTLPAQAATLTAAVRATAAQQLGAPTQAGAINAPNASLSVLGATQFLPLPAVTATAVVVLKVQASQALRLPAQVAAIAAAGPVTRQASAAQVLRLPAQVAVAKPYVVPVVIGPAPPDRPVEADETPPAIGDVDDIIARQAEVLPPWFGAPGTVPPVLRIPLTMAATVGSWLHDLIAYARLQTRIKTATEGWLDLIAFDFFGSRIRRRAGQGDEAFRRRVLVEMFRPRATRPAMVAVLEELTGYTSRIFEPSRPQDVGGIGIASGLGIGVAGAIGSIGLPGEVFITAYRDPDAGIPFAAGIGASTGGIGVPSFLVIGSLDQIRGALTDADVFGVVEATRPVGIRVWVRLALGERKALPPITSPVPPA